MEKSKNGLNVVKKFYHGGMVIMIPSASIGTFSPFPSGIEIYVNDFSNDKHIQLYATLDELEELHFKIGLILDQTRE